AAAGAFHAVYGGPANEINRPTGAAVAAALARGRRPGGDARVARAAIESEVRCFLRAPGFGSRGSALCRFRTHAGRRALSQGRVSAEPGDFAEMDEQSGLLASALPAGEKDPRLAGAASQFRRVGDAG